MKRLSRLRLIPTNFNHQTKELLDNSTIHGVRYMNEKGRVFGEKLLWFSCVVIGFVSALVIIDSLWEKFQTNPTITGLDTDFHNQEFTFPTFAICPNHASDPDKVNQTAQSIASDDDDYELYIPFLEALPKLTYDEMSKAWMKFTTSIGQTKFNRMKEIALRQLIFNVSLNCEDFFDECRFRDDPIKCCEHFTPAYNEHGFCFSFNGRYESSGFSETRLNQSDVISETDRRWELQTKLKSKAKAFLHSPDDVTAFEMISLFDIVDEDEKVKHVESLISMKQTYTTDDAKQLTVKQRKCIFQDEVDLHYYKDDIYSLSVCMIKCRMQKAMRLCKCIPPFYAPFGENLQSKSCKSTLENIACLARNHKNITGISGCSHCELSCFTTVYETEKFSLRFTNNSQEVEEAAAAANDNDEDHFFYVSVEFLSWPIIRYKKEVLFGWVDLLVSFGGIAGLFLGFSLLSGIEIIYFYTMRACCMFVKNREQLYELQKEKDSRPPVIYDLGFEPIFRGEEKPSSIDTISNIRMVKPVEPNNHDDNGFSLSTRKQTMNNLFSTNEEITRPDLEFNPAPFTLSYGNNGRQFGRPKQPRSTFSTNNADRYNSVMKPLDRKFWAHRRRFNDDDHQHEPIYYGYLP